MANSRLKFRLCQIDLYFRTKKNATNNQYELAIIPRGYRGGDGFESRPIKTGWVVGRCKIRKKKGRSSLYIIGILGAAAPSPTSTKDAAAAAASVPSSLTSTTALCTTWETNAFRFPSFFSIILPRFARRSSKIDSTPNLFNASFRLQSIFYVLNFGRKIIGST